ncbi:MAG: efflux RND transporter permease subunit [Gemmataceae bacterium]|nr:efflux RND transporter permease subunit [Gemmataceae bacterium]
MTFLCGALVFARFFIDRPIFAAVLSIVITLAGGLSVFNLPLAQFPRITPPTVTVSCAYPGASAKDVAEAVAATIEKEVNGVEGMMYMSSSCTNDGSYNLTVTFHQGVDVDVAQVLVQNRVALAIPKLPDVIKATGVITRKRSPDILMGVALSSPGGRYKQLYLSNYALRAVKDELSRVPGVGDVFLFGQRDYSMRIWVDPAKLAARNLSASDVVLAVREQNSEVATGMIGQQPVRDGQESAITLDTLGRLQEVEQFENIVIRADARGRLTRVKDVARVELGARNQDVACRMDGRETVFLAIFQLPDANALDTAARVRAKMDELKSNFPEDLTWEVGFETTPYTRESIREVVKTLRDAVLLVALVVLLFLQNWRTALIPLAAVPVAIFGTFAVMAALGFSLNNLTLFGLVLAIGIVVDDAIVVVEAVEHHIENGLAPRAATLQAMEQVSGPVIAVGLVLSAVFVPCAFIGGITGLFFRQFALTISASTLISAFNSLTLSPALAALLLRPRDKQNEAPLPWVAELVAGGVLGYLFLADPLTGWSKQLATSWPVVETALAQTPTWGVPALAVFAGMAVGWLLGRPLNHALGWCFRRFNAAFGRATGLYTRAVGGLLRVSALVLLVYGGLLALTYWSFGQAARGFIPQQDMGYLMVTVQLPDSASTERTDAVMRRIEKIAIDTPGIRHATGIVGQSFALNATGSNFGSMFINLKDYADRRTPDLSADAIVGRLMGEFGKIPDALVQVFPPPPVRGVGRAGGFAFVLEDRGDLGPVALQNQTDNLIYQSSQQPGLMRLFTAFRANVPQLHVQPNARACEARGVRISDVQDTLRIYQGSLYVNEFNRFGRTWQVVVQSDAPFRTNAEQVSRLKVRTSTGAMVPLGSLAEVRETNGPLVLTRYNMYPAATINGSAAPGMSSRQAIDVMQRLAERELPQTMAYEWTDMSYLELQAGNTALVLFACAAVAVFLVLAAQYESWSLPLAVILVVPMCLLSAVAGVLLAGQDINLFTQIGFVVLVGLASKNAILIVEFAEVQRDEGRSRREATLAACRLRLRPIIMTSVAFILGVVPLLISHGAGFEMRRTLGIAVFSGMIGVTLFGIFLTPVFFYVIDALGATRPFRSRALRLAGDLALGTLTLGLGRLGTWLQRRRTPPAQPPAPPNAPGQ